MDTNGTKKYAAGRKMRRIAQPRIERCMAFCYAGFFVLFFFIMVVEDARERRNRSESVTIVFVICKNQYDDGLIAVKSAIAYSKSPLRIIIITDDIGQKDMLKEVGSWPGEITKRVRVDIHPLRLPDTYNLANALGPCAAQELFLASALPHEGAVIYANAEMVFLHPVENLWRILAAMDGLHLTAMAPETESAARIWYQFMRKEPPPLPFGMTSGLVLMNLTRMRELGLEQRLTELDRETAATGRRGDMLSNLFTGRPEALRTFSCCWHFHSGHCNGSALCIDGPVAAVRGSQQVPAFAALRDAMRQYVLGGSLEKEFVAPLSARLDSMMPSNCSMHFKRQLPIWLQVARHVDNELVPITLDRNLLRFQHPPLPGQ
ncbi:glucoside xylosyltransferase 2-like isoform X2 [Dermacentor albipictus]|uniref:glucoside xylosyltransferase 2-like isoform X2 n=1 Tax=Dermacentor albipictus TaxID=60249 RepID=UPI0031FE4068